jgi:hypothetical protein
MGRIRQGRLFNPVGMYTGDPWKMSPDRWVNDQSRGPVVHHGGSASSLPAYDDPDRSENVFDTNDEYGYINAKSSGGSWQQDLDEDLSEGRRRARYGYATGMHFGSKSAAYERASKHGKGDGQRTFIHTARIPGEDMDPTVYGDRAANYSTEVDDRVHMGQAIQYRNDLEDEGSTSYRAKPETVRTWGEDVMEAADRGGVGKPHPAMEAAARAGYNPIYRVGWDRERDVPHWDDNQAAYDAHGLHNPAKQPQLWGAEVAHRQLRDRMWDAAWALPRDDFYHGKPQAHHINTNLNPTLFKTGLRE